VEALFHREARLREGASLQMVNQGQRNGISLSTAN